MRPRKKDTSKATKDAVLTIRVSQADKERYEAEAERYGMSTSKYILYSVDHKAINVIEGGSEIVRAMYDLNCSVNKHQARDNLPIDELRERIRTLVDKMNHFYKHLKG